MGLERLCQSTIEHIKEYLSCRGISSTEPRIGAFPLIRDKTEWKERGWDMLDEEKEATRGYYIKIKSPYATMTIVSKMSKWPIVEAELYHARFLVPKDKIIEIDMSEDNLQSIVDLYDIGLFCPQE